MQYCYPQSKLYTVYACATLKRVYTQDMEKLENNGDRLYPHQKEKIRRIAKKKNMTQGEAHRYIIDKYKEK